MSDDKFMSDEERELALVKKIAHRALELANRAIAGQTQNLKLLKARREVDDVYVKFMDHVNESLSVLTKTIDVLTRRIDHIEDKRRPLFGITFITKRTDTAGGSPIIKKPGGSSVSSAKEAK